jgi:tRNA(fMet)-specific endonuclease VapC
VTWLLDTNVCVNYLRSSDGSPIADHLAENNADDVVLCSVVRAELVFGALKSRDAAANLAKVRRLLSRFFSLPFDDAAAEAYGQIRAHLTKCGMTIGPNDLMIASIASARTLTLVTHNVGEFSRVPGLRIEDWEAAPSSCPRIENRGDG